MIRTLTGFVLDIFIFGLLFLAAPLIAALVSDIMPVYARVIGVIFILLITGAVLFKFNQTRRRQTHRTVS